MTKDKAKIISEEKKKKENIKKPEETGIICTICQMDFEENQVVIELDCGKIHIFHGEWLKEWFKVKMMWPTCRKDINELYSS